MSVFVAVAGVMAGCNIIFIYAKQIYDKIQASGESTSGLTTAQDTYVIGSMGLVGAILSNWTVKFFSRRSLFIVFHGLMGVFLALVAVSVQIQNDLLVLINMSVCVVLYQASNGSGLWVYCAEIGNSVSMGIVLLFLMGLTLAQSLVCNTIVNLIKVEGLFYVFAGFQAITCLLFSVWMKETKGLSLIAM